LILRKQLADFAGGLTLHRPALRAHVLTRKKTAQVAEIAETSFLCDLCDFWRFALVSADAFVERTLLDLNINGFKLPPYSGLPRS